MNVRANRYVVCMTLLAALLIPITDAAALEPTPGYPAIQRAFLREEFTTVATLAQTFIVQNPNVPETSRVWVWLSLSLDRLQRPNEALKELDQLKARLAPDDPLWAEVLFWEGDVSRRAFLMIRAKLAFQRLLQQHSDSTWAPQAEVGLGLIYLHQQAFDLAVGHFHEVTLRYATAPVALDALLFEGLCQLRLGHDPEAAEIFGPLIDRLREPNVIAQAAFYLGESLTGLKRYDDAVQAYHRAIASKGSLLWSQLAQFGLGWTYYQTDQCQESIDAFERYLTQASQATPSPPVSVAQTGLADHRTEALFAQGSCLLRVGREQDALARFERILSMDPTHSLAVESGLVVAAVYRRAERLTAAKELLHTLLRPGLDALSRAKIQLQLGAIALDQGNAAQARTVFELASEVQEPTIRQQALSGLGDVQMFLGNFTDAGRFYTEAIELSAQSPSAAYAHYQLGRLRLQLGAVEEAITIFQRLASSAEPALADEANLALALSYLSRHEEGPARVLLEQLRQQQPKSILAARAAYYLALLALGRDDEALARELCQETMARAPKTEEAIDARLLLADMSAQRTSVQTAMEWLRQTYATSGLPGRYRAKLARRLGEFARTEGQYAEAIRWYEAAAELLPSLGAETAYWIASCYEEVGDLERAMSWYGAIEQPPWRVRGQLAFAKLLEHEDRTHEAEAIYERLAVEPIPEAEVVRERLAVLRGTTTAAR